MKETPVNQVELNNRYEILSDDENDKDKYENQTDGGEGNVQTEYRAKKQNERHQSPKSKNLQSAA